MKNKSKADFNPIAIYIVLSLVAPAWLAIIYGIFTMGDTSGITKFTYIASIVAELTIFIIFLIKYRQKLIDDLNKLTLKQIGVIILIGIAIIAANEGLSTLFVKLNVETENQDMIIDMFNSMRIPTIISVAICAPIIEELVFRYSIGTLVKSDKVFLIVSSLAFGIMHGIGIITILYVLIGVALGLVYLKYKKNVVAPMIIHIMNNSFSVILLLLSI